MKKYISFLLVAFMLICFTGCGEEVSSVTDTTDSKISSVTSSVLETDSSEIKDNESDVVLNSSEETVVSSSVETEPEEDTAITLKVATFNIANGSFVQHNFYRIASAITAKDIDVIGFQEVDKDSGRSLNKDTMKELSTLTGYKYYYYCESCEVPGSGGVCGNGILSKYPIVNEEKRDMNTFNYVGRNIQHVELEVQGVKVNFYNTHFTWETKDVRVSHFDELTDFTKGKKNVIVTGDFNVESLDEYDRIETLNKVSTEENPHETWLQKYEAWPTSCLDNIFYSKEIKYVSSAVDTYELSDHKMLYAEFEIK